jgi:hypothetical protein
MGLVPADTQPAEAGGEVPDWNSLPETSANAWYLQKDFEALCMSAYAGMMDKVNQNVGRIIDHLADPDGNPGTNDLVLDNTLIIFFRPWRSLRPWRRRIRTRIAMTSPIKTDTPHAEMPQDRPEALMFEVIPKL